MNFADNKTNNIYLPIMSSLKISNSVGQFFSLSNLLRSICDEGNTYTMQSLEPLEQRLVILHNLVKIALWNLVLQFFSIPKLNPISVQSRSVSVRVFPIAQSSRVEPL